MLYDVRAVLMAALFEPFPLWLATWEAPSLGAVPLISLSKGRVVHTSKVAKQAGITPGSSLASALTRVPDLEAVKAASPYLAASWEQLVEELSGLTQVLETPSQGRLLMDLGPAGAAQLAESYRVRVGLAESVEMAHLAALISSPGRVRGVGAARQDALVDALPLYVLKGLGLGPGALERLRWLGIERVGQLKAWKRAQVLAYLGPEGKGTLPYLFGPYRTQLGRYTPPPRVIARLDFDEPLSEPHMLHPVVEKLTAELVRLLEGKTASRLSVVALSRGLELKATRMSKTPLQGPGETTRLAFLALEDTHALPLGIDALAIELGGFTRPAQQGRLWPQKERVEEAIAAVEARFPGALLRLAVDDPYALASEHRVRLVSRSTGEEVTHAAADDAGEPHDRRERPPIEA